MEAYDGPTPNWIGSGSADGVLPSDDTRRFMALTPERDPDPLRLYCIVSKEVFAFIRKKGAEGKGHAQSGHAWLHAYWDAEARFPEAAAAYRDSPHAYKITLKVATEDELRAIYEAHEGVCGRTLVEDAGFTVFERPTITCVGLGPVRRSQLVAGVGELKPF
jgi:peptidyl-tRNA hydrolase